MTCIVAIKQGNTVVMAADGQVTSTSDLIMESSRNKIINIDNKALVGVSGGQAACVYVHTIVDVDETVQDLLTRADSEMAILYVMGLITEQMKEAIDKLIVHDKGDIYASLLVANRYGIWTVDTEGKIVQCRVSPNATGGFVQYAAIGQGRVVAETAIHSATMWRSPLPMLTMLAGDAVDTASTFYSGCGPCQSLEELTFKE